MTAAVRAWGVGKMWGKRHRRGVFGRNVGLATGAGSRFISAEAGETSAVLPGTSPSVHQIERTWNGEKCAGGRAFWQEVFHSRTQEQGNQAAAFALAGFKKAQ
jgi:hypothetical protein